MTIDANQSIIIRPTLKMYINTIFAFLFFTIFLIKLLQHGIAGEFSVKIIIGFFLSIPLLLFRVSRIWYTIEFKGPSLFDSVVLKTFFTKKTYSLDRIRIAILTKSKSKERLVIIPSEVNDEKLKPTLPTRRELGKAFKLYSSSVSYPEWSAIINSFRPKIKEMYSREILDFFKEVKNSDVPHLH